MNQKVQFEVSISNEDRISFANLSGDYNPLHTNEEYAATTEYGKCILHGAFSSGLFSKMAGMYIPGEKCVLVDMKIKFVSPTITPCEVIVIGESMGGDKLIGEVKVSIINKKSGLLLTNGSYKYLLHNSNDINIKQRKFSNGNELDNKFLVTGASGGLGSRVLKLLDNEAIGLSLSNSKQYYKLNSYSELSPLYKLKNIRGIIHCSGPSPDNNQLTETFNLESDIQKNISQPLQDIISLSKLLKEKGIEESPLIIIGSSAAYPGRHNWKMPMYSLSKSLIPNLTKILALEMSRSNKKIIGLTFEVLNGGMSNNLSPIAKQVNSDRMLYGNLTSMDEAAQQVKWILENRSKLISGSVIDCTGGAIP